jgi:hypothetical protein
MRYRIGFVALFVACAAALQGQDTIFKVELVPAGSMISFNEPILKKDVYVFRAWPDGALTSLRQARVAKITRVTGPVYETVYKLELVPSGVVIAKDNPTPQGATYVFRTWRDGTYMSVRQADIRKITRVTGDKAFWAEEGQKGEVAIGDLPMQGGSVIEIASLPMQGGSTQAGPTNANAVGRGISGAPVYGNWQYQGTPGTSDAYGPANATVSSPGGVPTMPAATDGSNPPR